MIAPVRKHFVSNIHEDHRSAEDVPLMNVIATLSRPTTRPKARVTDLPCSSTSIRTLDLIAMQ